MNTELYKLYKLYISADSNLRIIWGLETLDEAVEMARRNNDYYPNEFLNKENLELIEYGLAITTKKIADVYNANQISFSNIFRKIILHKIENAEEDYYLFFLLLAQYILFKSEIEPRENETRLLEHLGITKSELSECGLLDEFKRAFNDWIIEDYPENFYNLID